MSDEHMNPVDGGHTLKPQSADVQTAQAHPQQHILPGDSATTRAEKIERQGDSSSFSESPAKRQKLENGAAELPAEADPRKKGVAAIKPEYLVHDIPGQSQDQSSRTAHADDDAAEAGGKDRNDDSRGNNGGQAGGKDKKKNRGQNKNRQFGSFNDEIRLCRSRVMRNEFNPADCSFGDRCKLEHDLRKYLADGKRANMDTLGGKCPIYETRGRCNAGWKCRWVSSHSTEIKREDGRSEMVLSGNTATDSSSETNDDAQNEGFDVVNVVPLEEKNRLRKKQTRLDKCDVYLKWIDERQQNIDQHYRASRGAPLDDEAKAAMRAEYVESPLKVSEKRQIYYGPETPILAPLTTQGNLPFRRLCVSLGAQVTWSEMAMGLPLIQGEKSEWALLKAHKSETAPPRYNTAAILPGYDNARDLKFGAQIAANKPWLAIKATEALTMFCPSLRAIDLNCGCPIDLVYRQGAGSALLDTPGKLEKILRGMNSVSGEVPITVKIRMGTKDNDPTADKLVERFVIGGGEARDLGEGPAGVAAIALHGRSRQQRYTRSADWSYISKVSATIERLQRSQDDVTDTVREADARDLTASNKGKVYFIGNGDCYSHVDYYDNLANSKVDAVMVARGALIKPWIFEEIEQKQYLDKSASERLAYIEQFVRNGLEYWGSDDVGIGTTRRYLLEWLSFACRYVPLGLLEHLPPRLGDRPPTFKGRNELETLLSSPNYKDWIKIRYANLLRYDNKDTANARSDMFLGPANDGFRFQPKHKSNSYEIEAEG